MKITKRRRKRYGGSLGGDIFIFAVLVLLGLFMLFPIYLAVIQSLKPVEELFLFPPRMYVQNITDQNFADLLATASNMWVPFSRYVFNSVFVAVVVTVAQLLFSSSAAYALTKARLYRIYEVLSELMLLDGTNINVKLMQAYMPAKLFGVLE